MLSTWMLWPPVFAVWHSDFFLQRVILTHTWTYYGEHCSFIVCLMITSLTVSRFAVELYPFLPVLVTLILLPWREAGLFWCLPPVWNLRAVIWFHLSICSLVILPSPVAHSVFSFFLLLAQSPAYFSEMAVHFFVLPLFLAGFFSGWEMISWSVVSVACYFITLVLAVYAFRHVSFGVSWCLLMIFYMVNWIW